MITMGPSENDAGPSLAKWICDLSDSKSQPSNCTAVLLAPNFLDQFSPSAVSQAGFYLSSPHFLGKTNCLSYLQLTSFLPRENEVKLTASWLTTQHLPSLGLNGTGMSGCNLPRRDLRPFLKHFSFLPPFFFLFFLGTKLSEEGIFKGVLTITALTFFSQTGGF